MLGPKIDELPNNHPTSLQATLPSRPAAAVRLQSLAARAARIVTDVREVQRWIHDHERAGQPKQSSSSSTAANAAATPPAQPLCE